MTHTISVELPDNPYEIHVGRGLLGEVAGLVDLGERSRILVVTQPPVARYHLQALVDGLQASDHRVEVVEVPDGEGAKSPDVLGLLWTKAASIPLTRRDVVVALGGGVVGDLAGFLAATWNRGVAVVQVPTTVLAQVDAAVGGKTGINLPEGKNLVGAFHQPRAVVADVETLTTLDERTRREGFAEVVKAGLLRDERILELLEDRVPPSSGPVDERTVELIRRAVDVKARVVAADELEVGERALLNLGHTLGHAIEALEGYGQWLHGEAVSAGLVAALEVGRRLEVTPPALVARIERLLTRLDLPTRMPHLPHAALWQVLARDKKADRSVHFVVVRAVGDAMVVSPSRAVVDEVVAGLSRDVAAEADDPVRPEPRGEH